MGHLRSVRLSRNYPIVHRSMVSVARHVRAVIWGAGVVFCLTFWIVGAEFALWLAR